MSTSKLGRAKPSESWEILVPASPPSPVSVMGMVKATAGRVNVAGFDLAEVSGDERRELDRLRQVVLQDPFSSLNPRVRVRDIIAEPLTAGAAESRREIRSSIDGRVAELLRMVGLPEERARAYPHQFSGGQRQRISIARALAPRPKLIVLDEPTSALDVSVRAQILTLLRNLQEELGLTYLVISHDLMTVAYLTSMASSKVAVMYRGRVVEVGPTGRVFHSPRHPYTLRLLSSVPRADIDFLSRSDFFEAEDSGASLPESSCRYAGRCVLRAGLGSPGQCNSEPPLNDVGPDHRAACHFSDEVDEFSWSEEG